MKWQQTYEKCKEAKRLIEYYPKKIVYITKLYKKKRWELFLQEYIVIMAHNTGTLRCLYNGR